MESHHATLKSPLESRLFTFFLGGGGLSFIHWGLDDAVKEIDLLYMLEKIMKSGSLGLSGLVEYL